MRTRTGIKWRGAVVAVVLVISCLIALAVSSAHAAAAELRIAAASDLNFAFKELVAAYEKKTGVRVKLSLGSSGNFYSQIENGAPFDLYFSADIRYPQKLEERGYAIKGSLYRYAIGRIVLWAARQSHVRVEEGLQALTAPDVAKVAIANPRHAPYGRAAVAALQHLGLYDQVKDKLILGENISQAGQFVESGACDAGIIALSLALAPSMKKIGTYWEIPVQAHPPIEQGAAILTRTKHERAAREFLDFVRSPEGQEIMVRYGFTAPGAP